MGIPLDYVITEYAGKFTSSYVISVYPTSTGPPSLLMRLIHMHILPPLAPFLISFQIALAMFRTTIQHYALPSTINFLCTSYLLSETGTPLSLYPAATRKHHIYPTNLLLATLPPCDPLALYLFLPEVWVFDPAEIWIPWDTPILPHHGGSIIQVCNCFPSTSPPKIA